VLASPDTHTAGSNPSPGAAGEQLLAWRCGECGRTSYPRRERCPFCWSEEGAELALPTEGEVHSFTTIHVGRSGTPVPYTVAYVDVGDVRLFARLTGEPRVGARGRIRVVAAPDDPPESSSLVVEVLEEAERDG
jgi:uncharacterized OB-fold protein